MNRSHASSRLPPPPRMRSQKMKKKMLPGEQIDHLSSSLSSPDFVQGLLRFSSSYLLFFPLLALIRLRVCVCLSTCEKEMSFFFRIRQPTSCKGLVCVCDPLVPSNQASKKRWGKIIKLYFLLGKRMQCRCFLLSNKRTHHHSSCSSFLFCPCLPVVPSCRGSPPRCRLPSSPSG